MNAQSAIDFFWHRSFDDLQSVQWLCFSAGRSTLLFCAPPDHNHQLYHNIYHNNRYAHQYHDKQNHECHQDIHDKTFQPIRLA